jgi:hypothetical protein
MREKNGDNERRRNDVVTSTLRIHEGLLTEES